MELQPGVYPGAALRWPVPDWSPYDELVFELCLDQGAPLDLVVKIVDATHNGEYEDRFHRKLRLEPGTREFRISLAEVAASPRGRQLDLRRIASLQFFTSKLGSARRVYLDNVHLSAGRTLRDEDGLSTPAPGRVTLLN